MDEFVQRLQSAIGASYAIERELGGGGMSRVFVAREAALDRPVVVKVLPPELSAAISVERFRREIRIAARLQHPHIVPVLAAGDAGGMLYYTMPLITGESLRAHLSRGELPISEALRILREIADALCRAHDEGVIHRDLKPENVLLSGEHAQVSDFGVAKALHAASGTEAVTSTGIAMGTPAYMAPEQIAADEHVDGRADIYALGVLAYEMLAGQPPFAGQPQTLFAQHMTVEPPPLAPRRPNAPPRLVALVERCLQKRPADRPQTIREVLDELRAIETSGGFATSASAARAAPRGSLQSSGGAPRRRLVFVGAAVLVAVLGTAAWLATRGGRSTLVAEAASLAILPFGSPSADSALDLLGRDLVVTVSTNLDGVAELRVADPMTVLAQVSPGSAMTLDERRDVAGVVRARSVVHGTLVRAGRLVRADVVVETVDSSGARVLGRGSVSADSEDVSALTDSVTWEVLRLVWRGSDLPTPTLAELTTRSLEALKAYLDGERSIVANEWADAEAAFGRAIRADSTFWMAHWRYNYARAWQLFPTDSISARKVEENLAAFSERDRLTIEVGRMDSLAHRYHGYGELAARYPDSWFIALRLADLLTHDGPALGTAAEDAMRAWERVLTLHPGLGPAYSHLATVAMREHDTTRLRFALDGHTQHAEGAVVVEGLPHGGEAFLRSVLAWESGDSSGAVATLSEAIDGAPSFAAPLVRFQLMISRQPHLADAAREPLRRAVERSVHVADATRLEWIDLLMQGMRGRWNGIHDSLVAIDRNVARLELQSGNLPFDPRGTMEEVLAVAAWTGGLDPREAKKHAERLAPTMGTPELRARLAWIDGIIAAALADREGIERARTAVGAAGGSLTNELDAALLGMDLWLSGDAAASARVLDSLSLARGRHSARRLTNEYPTFDAVLRLAAARSTLAVSDTAAALRNLAYFDIWAMTFAAMPVTLFSPFADYERARIAQAQGRRDDAVRHYERLLEVYTHPPPGHTGIVEDARKQLAVLSGLREAGS